MYDNDNNNNYPYDGNNSPPSHPEPPQAENPEIPLLRVKVQSGRRNLCLLALLTLFNLVLTLFELPLSFPFSMYIPSLLIAFGKAEILPTGPSFATAFGLIALLLFLWKQSEKQIIPIIFYLLLFALDFVVLLLLISVAVMLQSSIIDILFHVWASVTILMLLVRSVKLRRLIKESSESSYSA